MFYISFWSFWHHMKTCKKNFWKILIFCQGFCNVFQSSTAFGKVDVATMQIVPRPWTHYQFTIASWGRSTESFIKISSLVPEIFNILRFDGFQFYANSAFMGTLCTHEGWIWVKMKPIITQNIEYLRNQWRYLDETFCALSLWCGCKMMMVTWAWHKDHGCQALFSGGSGTFKHVTKNLTKNQNFSKILFASFQVKPEASKSYIQHFSICNIKGVENFSWSLPVHLF